MIANNISNQDKINLTTTIEHYLVNSGFSVKEATEESQTILTNFLSGSVALTLWEALINDDAGLVESNISLKEIRAYIALELKSSQKNTKH